MIARIFGVCSLLIGSSGLAAQDAGRPADLPPAVAVAGAEVQGPAAHRAKEPSPRGEKPGVGAPVAKPSPGADDRTRRVRELIYFFRTYRVFCRDEEWAQTIRELAAIGKDAVPELVAELDRTDRDGTLRSLAFSLRAIGDRRAVPALIRAIPKALRPPGSDCGVGITDPALRAFMKAHQNYKNNQADYVACGRPVNEILSALERLTGHREPPEVGDNDPLRHVFLGGTPEQQAQQRATFEERRRRWEAWWKGHSQEFATPEELRSVDLPRRDEDLVEKAGIARYGELFPTGAGVRLGPARMLRLTTQAYADAKSHLDLDTGRVFGLYEGLTAADWRGREESGSPITAWYRKNGIDVRCQGPVDGVDLQLWQVDNGRWDTLEAEIQKGGPLPLGAEATSYLVHFDKSRTDFKYDELGTFLFTTREGGRGIIQVFPKDQDTDRYRLRYRLWSTASPGPEGRPTGARPTSGPRGDRSSATPFGKVVVATLERPAEGRPFLLDFETGPKAAPVGILKPQEIAQAFSLPQNDRFARWCRDQGIDAFGYQAPREAAAVAPAKALASRRESPWTLIGLDMTAARILPQSFDEMTIEEVRELLDRMPEQKPHTAWMPIEAHLAERPDTFAFRTRSGAVGILQLTEAADEDAGQLTIRFRLERRD